MIDVVCGVVRNDKGEYLITQRGDLQHCGKWEFLGGKVQNGETWFECILREIKEEIHIDIEPIRYITNYTFQSYNLIFILCELRNTSQSILLNEHLDFKWVCEKEILNYEFVEGDEKFIEDYICDDSVFL
jgi:8-oxo-dGTP diphosphatase